MIRSSADVCRSGPARLEADVCVIGSGAAGLTLARQLAGTRLRVCLLESGERGTAAIPDPLYEVRATALPVAPDARARAYGGTLTVWAGRWKRLDAIDLEPRDWVPHSGWPIADDELARYYDRAAALAEIREDAPDAPALLASDIVVPAVFQTQDKPARDWGRTWRRALEAADNVDIVLGAHVVGIERDGRRATRVVCRTARGDQLAIAPRIVVVAAGGIENARLLLLSRLGDEHGWVGRGYMDHPRARFGVIELYEPVDRAYLTSAAEGAPSYRGYRLADAVQREDRVLNSHIFLAPLLERDLPRRLIRRVIAPRRYRMLTIRHYLEQAPDPANRVYLADEVDPYGQPRAAVAWTLGALDKATIVAFHRRLARELQRARLGELHSPLLADPDAFPAVNDASHPSGTTRMGLDPRTSVVDPDGRLHAVDNVYVAGSSVFPTSGYANPTATIVALAIRLADALVVRA